MSKVNNYARQLGMSLDSLPRVQVLTGNLLSKDMPKLFKAFDAFVLPSRGEGWGLPIMEAMAMEMPCIATNWSGITEFINEENSFPLEIEGFETFDLENIQARRAKPSVNHLRQLMRYVITHPKEAKRKGVRARQDVIKNFSEESVSQRVLDRLATIRHGWQ